MYSYTDAQPLGLGNATELVICSGTYNEYFASNGEPNPDGYVQRYVEAAADMAKHLYTTNGKQVWIGTPIVGNNVTYSKTVFEEVGPQMTCFIDNMIAQFGRIGLSFDTVVKDIYMSDEEEAT